MMKLTKITAAIVFMVFVVVMSGPAAFAQDKMPTAEKLWDQITRINPGLNDYSVDLKIGLKVKYNFLNPRLDIDGTYYFKKPDKHRLKLNRASYLLDKYPKIFGWSLPSLKEFNSTVTSDKIGARDYYLVTLTPKTIAGDVEKEQFWIDKKDYTFPRHIYQYKSGGLITLSITYRKEKNFQVYDNMNATFSFPKENLNAEANASYGAYKFNQGLSDSFFDAK